MLGLARKRGWISPAAVIEPGNEDELTKALARIDDPFHKTAGILLVESRDGSRKKAVAAIGRANFILGVGTLMALAGLLVFVTTNTPEAASSEAHGLSSWRYILGFLPRISVLVFVEILAGFFLRQYRALMEEYRYYEGLERQRDADLASFFACCGDGPSIRDLTKVIRESIWSGGTLKAGELSPTLEAAKASENEFTKILQTAAEALTKVVDVAARKS
jgi:hypothetical protein